jgi:hypothetical protein
MRLSFRKAAILAAALAVVPIVLLTRARGSDHADTPAIAASPGIDLTDLFVFPSPTNPSNVVLAMCVHPLIPSGMGPSTFFDPNVLYQFKIDNTGDSVEDLVIQAKFIGTGTTQQVQISSGVPVKLGTVTQQLTPDSVVGAYNTTFTTSNGMKVFAGPREDPFFFDLAQFLTILPDRANPLGATFTNTAGTPTSTTPADPDMPMAGTFRAAGAAQDFLKGLNVLAIVVEVPKTQLIGTNNGKINVWCTTSR